MIRPTLPDTPNYTTLRGTIAVSGNIGRQYRHECVSAPDREPSRNRPITLISNPKYE